MISLDSKAVQEPKRKDLGTQMRNCFSVPILESY